MRVLAVFGLLLGLSVGGSDGREIGASASETENDLVNGVPAGVDWFYNQRAYPKGIPVGAFEAAGKTAAALPHARRNGKIVSLPMESTAGAVPTWTPMGPNPLTGPVAPTGFQQYTGPAPWSGRVTAIANHPTDANTAYVGGAMGGVWKTTDGGAHWTPLFDGEPSMAIGSIAIARTNPLEVFVGTGEANSAPFDTSDSYYGAGLFRSTDGGQTWTHVSEARFDGCHIGAIQVSPSSSSVIDVAVASASGRSGAQVAGRCVPGIYRSVDGGSTWSVALNTVTATEFPALDLFVDPAAPTVWYAGLQYAGVYRSIDSGATWSRLTNGLPPISSVGRVAISGAGSGSLYAVIANPSTADPSLEGVFASSDSGDSWHAVSSPNICSGGGGSQCDYDLTVAADPATPSTFYAGGVTFRRFTSAGASSAPILNPTPVNGVSGVHWDAHVAEFDAADRLWLGTDGGVWRTSDGGSTVQNLNAGLSLEQFYPGISGSGNGPLLGGMQDNASALFQGSLTWHEKGYGDGSGTAYDTSTNPATMYVTSYNFSILRSTDGGQTWIDGLNSGIGVANAHEFIWPFAQGGGSPRRLYAGANVVYRSVNRATSWQAISPVFADARTSRGGRITAIAEGPSSNGAVVYAGTHDGQIRVTTDSGSTWPDTNGNTSPVPWRYITDFAVNPSNAADAYVAVSGFDATGTGSTGHVFHTINAGVTWSPAYGTGTGALPDTPVSALAVDRLSNPQRLFAGTDVGVFVSVDGGTNWATYGAGLPAVAVQDLLIDTQAGKLVAATHGRGMFVSRIAAPPGNDAFTSPSLIAGNSGTAPSSTAGATKEAAEPDHGGTTTANIGGASVWFSWTPTATAQATVDTVGSGPDVDTLLSVYTGSTLAGLTLIAGNDDITGQVGGSSQVTFDATAGTTYRIAVDGYKDGVLPSTGAISLNWAQQGVVASPTAAPDSYSVRSPASLTVPAPGLLSNDSDVGTDVALAAGTGPQHGTVNVSADGSFTYSPAAGYVGADTFQYCIAAGAMCASNIATATITVQPPDTTSPTVQITTRPAAATSNTTAQLAFTGTDADSPPVTFTCALDGALPTLCSSPRSYVGLADGLHSFSVQAHDAAGNTSAATTATWRMDTFAPTVALTGPTAAFTLSSAAKVTWTGADTGGSGVANYQVRYTRAYYNGGFVAWSYPSSWQALTTASLTPAGLAQGYDYCWSVRAIDRASNASAWTASRCTSVALDDRSLSATTSGWTRAANSAWWNGTASTTKTLNATLARTTTQFDRVGIVATRCVSCGIVGIYAGGTLIGKINLFAASTAYRQILLLPKLSYRTGTVVLKVLTSGKIIQIDGLAVCRT